MFRSQCGEDFVDLCPQAVACIPFKVGGFIMHEFGCCWCCCFLHGYVSLQGPEDRKNAKDIHFRTFVRTMPGSALEIGFVLISAIRDIYFAMTRLVLLKLSSLPTSKMDYHWIFQTCLPRSDA